MAKITKKNFKQALEGTGGIMLSIAKNIGCDRSTVYEFCNKYPEMMELRRQEEEKILDIAENGLFTQAKDKEQWAVKYLLATKGKKRGYVEKTESEITMPEGININLIEKDVQEIKDGKSNDMSKTKGNS